MNATELAGLVLTASGDGVVAFDRALACTYWNPAMERMFERAATDALGRAVPVLLGGRAPPRDIEAYLARVLAGEELTIENGQLGGGSGAYEAHYLPWRAPDGTVVGGVGLLHDTTRRREAELHARETESRFRNMADVAPVLLWMADPDALCTFFNQTWLDFTGRTLEEEWGVGWAEGVHYEDFQPCIDTFMAAFAKREVFEMEYRLRRADGQFRWVLDRGTPRYTDGGRFAGYIGSCVDITDRKDLEHELLRAVRVRDEFLSIASHELRTPLTALRLQLDSVARSLALRGEEHLASGRLAESTGDALGQVGRLTTLVERLLDISRFAEGRLSLDHEDLDLVALVRGVVDTMREPARHAGCDLTLTSPPALRGRFDRVRLEQVVTNLVANSVKFGERKPVEVTIAGQGATARVIVTDHGVGIDPQYQRRIFGRFERAVSARHFGGLGLGLWVAKQIVDAHAGSIFVESVPGEGATFTVVLPVATTRPPGRSLA